MKIAKIYSHLNGEEYLRVHHKSLWAEIKQVISKVNAVRSKTKISQEKRMRGKRVFSPTSMNSRFSKLLVKKDWKHSRVDYWVTDDHKLISRTLTKSPEIQKQDIEKAGKIPIYSYNQTDFVKDRVAIEVQFGKYSFVAYDLFVKHLAFYIHDKIDVGIEILPMKELQKRMSSGPGYFEGELYNVIRNGRGVPAVPLVIIGVIP